MDVYFYLYNSSSQGDMVSVRKVKPHTDLSAALRMLFTPDSKQLIIATRGCTIQVRCLLAVSYPTSVKGV